MDTIFEGVIFKGFDMEQLRNVALVLHVTNPRVGKVESCMHHIRDMAVANIREGDCTYIATMGWCVSGYWFGTPGDDWRYKVTLEPYGIIKHFNL